MERTPSPAAPGKGRRRYCRLSEATHVWNKAPSDFKRQVASGFLLPSTGTREAGAVKDRLGGLGPVGTSGEREGKEPLPKPSGAVKNGLKKRGDVQGWSVGVVGAS